MKTNEIRQQFVDYFVSKGHAHVASSPLVPGNDPTLLFTNAGMVQFKDVFLGMEKRPYNRAVTAQRCVRAGGKHNDLENVGYTARHHTFFEMLGNFSFGDYFKRDAIRYAWELLTVQYGLPADKLWTTVYETDDEAFELWTKDIGVPPERCIRIGDKPGGRKFESDNFWQMADTGPCGPCSEIFYDHGPGVEGGPPGSPGEDGDRYIEIWNLVFMQFNRDEAGTLNPLPKPSVDTGMGLERLTAVLQHVHSNYEIDLFQALIRAAAEETGTTDTNSPSLRVIADHIRACAFLVCDGVIPGNEGRGYVLRRIARRAMRHGHKLGQRSPFFYRLMPALIAEMGDAYPELRREQLRIANTLRQEEERFAETLGKGLSVLETAITRNWFARHWAAGKFGYPFEGEPTRAFVGRVGEEPIVSFDAVRPHNGKRFGITIFDLAETSTDEVVERISKDLQRLIEFRQRGDEVPDVYAPVFLGIGKDGRPPTIEKLLSASDFPVKPFDVSDEELNQHRVLSGLAAFTLYDTYGFPIDLTADIGRERGFSIDMAGFDAAMNAQQERSRAASKFKSGGQLEYTGAKTAFRGYDTLSEECRVVALYRGGSPVNSLSAGEEGIVVLDRTPFYAESGGQVGDRGEITRGGVCLTLFEVQDTQKIQPEVFGHHGVVKTGELAVGETVAAQVDLEKRARTMRHHSATHLMHKALREVLGTHVQQRGSLVDEDKTRFDFSHNAPMTADEIRRVENLVNAEILRNEETRSRVMPIDEAQKLGAMMLFGEKYGDEVRVLDIGGSRELCGGTHVKRTGDIGLFKITGEGGVAAGIRRIEAVAGTVALEYVREREAQLAMVEGFSQARGADLLKKLHLERDERKALERQLAQLKQKAAASQGDDLAASAVDVKGVKVLAAKLEGADVKTLRDTLDQLKGKLKSSAIVLAASEGEKVSLIAGVTADLIAKVKAGELVNFVAGQVGGKGGGRADMAQAGGTDSKALPKALESVRGWVAERL